jgi:ABC-type multidrug transport system permease subunit
LVIVCILLSCMVFSMLGMMAALLAKSHQSMATLNSLLILPMTFLCGTFFSVSSLNPVFQAILYCMPLTHASEIIRASALPDYLDFPLMSLVVLAAFGIAFFAIDLYLLKTRKV